MNYRVPVLIALVVIFNLITSLTVFAEPSVFQVDRAFYPNYPSLIKYEKSEVPFTSPEVCGECHVKQYSEWKGSVHSMAFIDPIYQGELNKATKAVGTKITKQCEGCHTPAGMLMGETNGAGISGLSPMALAGVSCDICHSVSSVTHRQSPTGDPENGSLVLTPGRGGSLVKRGAQKPSDNCGGGFHLCEQQDPKLKANLCASCHQVYHYDSHFPIEATYNEWKAGAYAQNDIFCQDCHMVDTKTFREAADSFRKPTREEYRHYFNGANYLLSYLGAAAAKKSGDNNLAKNLMNQYEMAIERLKSAADVELSPVYRDGRISELKITVRNLRAGHNLPTSLTNIREIWLEVTAKDDKGNLLLSSGILNSQGSHSADTRVFNSEGVGKEFHFAIDPWVVTSFRKHETIPPRGFKEVYYPVSPLAEASNILVNVKLRYRQADQKIAEALLGAVPKDIDLKTVYGLDQIPQLPVVDMVVKDFKLQATK